MKLFTLFIVSMLFLATGNVWGEINVNSASAPELAKELKNIGPAKAAAIVEYRNMHGAFNSVDELAGVHGIGKATIEMNKELIILDEPKSDAKKTGQSDVADSKHLN